MHVWGERTALWSWLCLSASVWVLEIELRLSALPDKPFYWLSHPPAPEPSFYDLLIKPEAFEEVQCAKPSCHCTC